jgi:predicted nucleotidyltransferase
VQSAPVDLARIVSNVAGMHLLVVHGSRARGDAHERSDWDFAYRAEPGLDPLEVHAALARALDTDQIDVADLDRAGALLRYRVACDGQVIYERTPGEFDDFRLDAILFWLDVAPVITAEHEAILERLG